MSEQTHGRRRDEGEDVPPPDAPAEKSQTASDDFDELLDEIDSVLESNAEEFVRSFVQKGGQ
ncbi:ubiquitin-like protein Pup [Desertihabitans brevis]|uniref:Prokaryotic ubiquitin-like protein Pup n=1 Tax=Desertihabitans brevis TaxID=2268447 RepID=A0A367YZ39_9ACTN|nr:ubiquitin-like protein Pup [Desertihabitans brevis]RCK71183.1 ubiquitin-like protein Pup [Desertihabitans brevis]